MSSSTGRGGDRKQVLGAHNPVGTDVRNSCWDLAWFCESSIVADAGSAELFPSGLSGQTAGFWV